MDRRKTLANRCTSSDASKMRSSRRLRAFPNQAVTISSKVGQPSIAEITSHYSRQCCRSEEKLFGAMHIRSSTNHKFCHLPMRLGNNGPTDCG